MDAPLQISLADEGEETLVTPRFDEEESNVAQPVVPLEVAARRSSPRPRMLALLLLATLVGGVLGGAGLYFYQSRSAAADVSSPEHLSAPAEVAPPSPAPTAVVSNEAQQPTPTPDANESAKDDAKAKAKEDATDANAQARESRARKETESVSTPARGKVSGDEGASADAPRRGKKGESDAGDSAVQSEQRPRRAAYNTQGPIPEDSSPTALRARRVEEGLRRAERTRERQRRRRENAARSRGGSIEDIFEGRP